MAQRVKGQNTVITIYQGGAALASFPVKDANFNLKLETSEEGYLGESADRIDQTFKGAEGDLTLHYEDEAIFVLADAIVQKARDLSAGPVFGVRSQITAPGGATPSIQADDVAWGDIPFAFTGRTEFNSVKLSFKTDKVKILSK